MNWPDTFAKFFDRVLGDKHISWKCFWRSAIASYGALLIVGIYVNRSYGWLSAFALYNLWDMPYMGFISNVLPDFVSLIETRYVLALMQRTRSG